MHGRDRRRVLRGPIAEREVLGADDGIAHRHRRARLAVVERHPRHRELAARIVGRHVHVLAVADGSPAAGPLGAVRRRETRDAPSETVWHVEPGPRLVHGKSLEDRALERRHAPLAPVRHAARHGAAVRRLHGVQLHLHVRARRGARRFDDTSVRFLHSKAPLWRAPWMILLYILVIALAVWLWYKRFLQQQEPFPKKHW